MAAVTYQLMHGTMPLQPIYIQLQMIFRSLTWEKTSMIHPRSLGDRSSTLSKPSSILEPEKSTCTSLWRGRRNRNQRRQIIKDGWADYEGEVVRSEDIQLEQNCPEETVAPSQVWREKIVIAVGITDYAIQRILGRLRKRRIPFEGFKNTERLAKR